MKVRFITAFVFILNAFCILNAQVGDLPRTSPESMGIPSEKVQEYLDSLMHFPNTEIHSVIIMRHGRIISEIHPAPFNATYGHTLFSCSKTFTAVAIGLAIEDKLIKLDDRIVTFFPDKLPYPASAMLSRITIEDLLTMRSGFVVDTKMRTISKQWISDYLAHPMNAEPGTRFAYDSIDTYLLSAIIQKVTGKTLLEFLKQRLFNPLNIREVKWEFSPEGITTGGWGLYLQAESMAKFGQLLLQGGNWKGRQIISAAWVKDMMVKHVTNNQGDDYCYQMWRCGNHNAARADGAYGQYIYVLPDKDMVIVVTQCMISGNNKQHQMIWSMLVPFVKNDILEEGNELVNLRKFENKCSLPLPEGKKSSKSLSMLLSKTLMLPNNPLEWISLMFQKDDKDNLILEISDKTNHKSSVILGHNEWITSDFGLYPPYVRTQTQNRFSSFYPPFKASGAYAWNDNVLHVKIHFVDWLTSVDMSFNIVDNKTQIEIKENYQAKPFVIWTEMIT